MILSKPSIHVKVVSGSTKVTSRKLAGDSVLSLWTPVTHKVSCSCGKPPAGDDGLPEPSVNQLPFRRTFMEAAQAGDPVYSSFARMVVTFPAAGGEAFNRNSFSKCSVFWSAIRVKESLLSAISNNGIDADVDLALHVS